MNRRQWTLKGLMIAIVWIGLGMAALFRPSKAWALILPVIVLSLDLTAILGVLLRRGSKRAYWLGFALFGWAYLILWCSWFSEHNLTNPMTSPGRIVSEALGGWIELFAIPSVIVEPGKTEGILEALRHFAEEVDDESRVAVACCMAGLLFSALGGKIARTFSAREASPTGPAPTANVERGDVGRGRPGAAEPN